MAGPPKLCEGGAEARGTQQVLQCSSTWRFMGSYKWSYKSPDISYNYSYPAYDLTYNYP